MKLPTPIEISWWHKGDWGRAHWTISVCNGAVRLTGNPDTPYTIQQQWVEAPYWTTLLVLVTQLPRMAWCSLRNRARQRKSRT